MKEGGYYVQWQEINVVGSLKHRGFPLTTAIDDFNIVILGGEGSGCKVSVFNVLTNSIESQDNSGSNYRFFNNQCTTTKGKYSHIVGYASCEGNAKSIRT